MCVAGVGDSFLSPESFASSNHQYVTGGGHWYMKMVSQSFIPGLARDCYWGEMAEDTSPALPGPALVPGKAQCVNQLSEHGHLL